tara:strand:+ start:141 stop:326 length:186 start_codon:yes stop_codon:yes gene_type:complete
MEVTMSKKNVSEATRKSIDREIKLQRLQGNKTFKNLWIGNGWLSKDKGGKVIFTTTKTMTY